MSDAFLRPKRSLGQNFLMDPSYLGRIADAAHLGPDDQVVEIGPGLGHLTRELARRSRKLVVIELDDRLIGPLGREFAGVPAVEIVHADALTYDFGSLQGRWKVVANLPYYISTPLLQRLLQHRSLFQSMTLMLQREVAERVAASPGGRDYGFLSVLVQYHAVPRIEFLVPPGAFTPAPKVESAVLTLALRERPAVSVTSEKLFLKVVKAAFGQRRKTLRNALKTLGCPPGVLAAVHQATGIDLGRRAETLTVADFGRLSNAIGQEQEIPYAQTENG